VRDLSGRGVGGAAAWPLAARAQQPPLPVVGYLTGGRLSEADVLALARDAVRGGAGYCH
jgi:hypothetical protein